MSFRGVLGKIFKQMILKCEFLSFRNIIFKLLKQKLEQKLKL